MKVIKKDPDSFYYQGDRKIGLLLIHGFAGSAAEMRLLGDFLHEKGYSVYIPLLKGHGLTPEDMAKTDKKDWWGSTLEGYELLKNKGYDQIVAVGLSLGAILALKLAFEKKLVGVVSMSAPIFVRDKRMGLARWMKYVIKYVEAPQFKQENNDKIDEYLSLYDRTPMVCVESLNYLIGEVRRDLVRIRIPIQIMQGKKDETLVSKSAVYIYDHVESANKELKWYENSFHVLTLDQAREEIFTDILGFLEKIS